MAKKQTRRSLSMSRTAYEALVALAHDRGIPAARIAESLIRKECGLPEAPGGNGKPRPSALELRDLRRPTDDELVAFRVPRESRQRLALDARLAAKQEQQEREDAEVAERNPCRLEGCSREGLHAAHEGPERRRWGSNRSES